MDAEMARTMTCTFTGHRPGTLPWGDNELDPGCVAIKKRLDEAVEDVYAQGFRHFICGMARGADFFFCEAVIKLRARHPDVRLEAAVPFPGQSVRWSAADRARYARLLKECDLETLIQQSYSVTCMQRRNRYMVDHADCIIAVYNGDPKGSGTLGTLNYALNQGLKIVLLEV